jgi:hypothetical protein
MKQEMIILCFYHCDYEIEITSNEFIPVSGKGVEVKFNMHFSSSAKFNMISFSAWKKR